MVTIRRLLRRICVKLLANEGEKAMIEDQADRIGHLCLQLHAPQFLPGQQREQRSDRAYARYSRPHGGPAAALQQRVADDFDVVAAPDYVRDPADAYRNVLDGKDQTCK